MKKYRVHYYINGRLYDSTHVDADNWENAFQLGRQKMRHTWIGSRLGHIKKWVGFEDDDREIEGEEYVVSAEPSDPQD